MRRYYVYILTNKPYGTLYIGVTKDLEGRTLQHKLRQIKGFSAHYKLCLLVYYEEFNDIGLAIQREKSLKRWYRDWKIELINTHNPQWHDLAENLVSVHSE